MHLIQPNRRHRAGLIQLYRFRNKLDESRTRIRFGQLYDGFSRENYLYEGWVTLRKLLIIIIGNFTDMLQVQLAIGSVGLLLGHTIFRQPYQTRSLTYLDELLLSCVFFTYWVGGIFTVFPECHSDAWEAALCTTGQWVVLLFNIACFGIGVGICIWLTWLNKREQLKGSTKRMCTAISRWRICRPCCRKGLGIWLRASQAEWVTNPLDREVELKEIVRSSMVGSPEEMVALLKGENKTLREKDKKLEKENKTLREEKKVCQHETKTFREKDKAREKENKALREENQRLKSASTDSWEGVHDKNYNRSTGETSWDPPMMTNPMREKDKVREKENKTLREENQRLKSASTYKWESLQDEEGNTYYHNRSTGETSWDPPMMTNPMRK